MKSFWAASAKGERESMASKTTFVSINTFMAV
jgi:hypothetical protein